jgi:hypothetical protein
MKNGHSSDNDNIETRMDILVIILSKQYKQKKQKTKNKKTKNKKQPKQLKPQKTAQKTKR